jgi:hypothetical protein
MATIQGSLCGGHLARTDSSDPITAQGKWLADGSRGLNTYAPGERLEGYIFKQSLADTKHPYSKDGAPKRTLLMSIEKASQRTETLNSLAQLRRIL